MSSTGRTYYSWLSIAGLLVFHAASLCAAQSAPPAARSIRHPIRPVGASYLFRGSRERRAQEGRAT